MPEGDTVWRTALHLDQALTGATLTASDFRVPAHATWTSPAGWSRARSPAASTC